MTISLPADYPRILRDLKDRIQRAQTKAAHAINLELVSLYWEIGSMILQRQTVEGWGTKIIERLSQDLRNAFPGMKGFSLRNLNYMKDFAAAYPGASILQQPAAKLPWTHLCLLLDKVKDPAARAWYIQATLDNGWGRDDALKDMAKPMGVAEWQTKLVESLPEDFKGSLPTIEELEAGSSEPEEPA
jgi:predicted nuclease of restriction endonuclease-like (RecB) superfamily